VNDGKVQFFNRSHPQTLQLGVMLAYLTALFSLLSFSGLLSILALLLALSAFGMANDKKIAWYGGVAIAALIVGVQVLIVLANPRLLVSPLFLISAGFDIALLVAFVHPQTRDYVKIWFG